MLNFLYLSLRKPLSRNFHVVILIQTKKMLSDLGSHIKLARLWKWSGLWKTAEGTISLEKYCKDTDSKANWPVWLSNKYWWPCSRRRAWLEGRGVGSVAAQPLTVASDISAN